MRHYREIVGNPAGKCAAEKAEKAFCRSDWEGTARKESNNYVNGIMEIKFLKIIILNTGKKVDK